MHSKFSTLGMLCNAHDDMSIFSARSKHQRCYRWHGLLPQIFCALSPCIEGFLEGCRPYLSVDSTALNGRWNGHLATAIAIDGHDWMYPVAFGFIDGETIDNWTWFMTQLHKAIGNLPLLAICTDACKGLEKVVRDAFPNAEHRECFRHLMQNFIKRFGGDIFFKNVSCSKDI